MSKWYLWPDFQAAFAEGANEKIWVLLLLVVQALVLRYIIKRNRLLQEDHFLVIFFYLYFAIQQDSSAILEVGVLPLLLMLAIHLIIGLYNTENPTNRLMGLGSVIGLAVIIDPATILILPYALLGLSYFILLDFRKSLIVGYFMVLMFSTVGWAMSK